MKIDVSVIIWTIVNFTVFMLLLNRFLFKPMLKFMDDRQRRIDEGISAGEQFKQAVEDSKLELRQSLEALRHDELLRSDEKAAQAAAAAQTRAAEEEAADADRRARALEGLEFEEKELMAAVSENSDMLIAALADKLLAEEV